MGIIITDASVAGSKLRAALVGPSGSGKTWTGMELLSALLAPGERWGVLDSEKKSALKYARYFRFRHVHMQDHAPQTYIDGLAALAKDGCAGVLVDSLSHAWMGRGGILEQVDAITASSRSKNAFTEGWREASPQHARLIDALLEFPGHVIVTMRVKMDYAVENVDGKANVRKLGLAPVQRDGLEYEFDFVGDMDRKRLAVTKTRFPPLDDARFVKPGKDLAAKIAACLTDDAPFDVAENSSAQQRLSSPATPRTPPPRPPAPTGKAEFGPHKNKPFSAMTPPEFAASLLYGNALTVKHSGEAWLPLLARNMTAMAEHIAQSMAGVKVEDLAEVLAILRAMVVQQSGTPLAPRCEAVLPIIRAELEQREAEAAVKIPDLGTSEQPPELSEAAPATAAALAPPSGPAVEPGPAPRRQRAPRSSAVEQAEAAKAG